MYFLNGWHPFESIRCDLVKITMWRCLVLQIWEQQKQRVNQWSPYIYMMYVILFQNAWMWWRSASWPVRNTLQRVSILPVDARFGWSKSKGQSENKKVEPGMWRFLILTYIYFYLTCGDSDVNWNDFVLLNNSRTRKHPRRRPSLRKSSASSLMNHPPALLSQRPPHRRVKPSQMAKVRSKTKNRRNLPQWANSLLRVIKMKRRSWARWAWVLLLVWLLLQLPISCITSWLILCIAGQRWWVCSTSGNCGSNCWVW